MNKLKQLIIKLYNMTPLRYIASSGVAFIIDYALLLVLEHLMSGLSVSMEIAAVIAWLVSSQTNFWINRLWVFKSDKKILPELGGYYALAGTSFCVKTFVLLELFCRVLNIPLPIAKPLAEAVMFAVNYVVQKLLIFKRRS